MRRKTRVVMVGCVPVGGEHPIVVQSMTTAGTLDTEAVVAEAVRLARAGCRLVRLTAQTPKEAQNLARVKETLLRQGLDIPLVADIHFSPAAALEAAEHAEKVRINPGNFVDSKRFLARDYSDAEYADELARVEERFAPLVEKLKRLGRALRIGANHGSLADRILNRYGDTPLGMVESALEYVRISEKHGYRDILLSMKASSPRVMIAAYRLLARRMDAEGMDYPLHLGVTEAGDGVDGRIKSAIGIGTLLAEGLGDTIRVSLTEPSENEIPVAKALVALLGATVAGYSWPPDSATQMPARRTVRVVSQAEGSGLRRPDLAEPPSGALSLSGTDPVGLLHAYRRLASEHPGRPVHIVAPAHPDPERWRLGAALLIGGLLCDGIGDSVEVKGEDPEAALDLAYDVLQGAGARLTKTDFVSCPSCGRTLFDLPSTTARIKARTGHLTGVKIAVMGCVVNGPGEMADADFGYVGAGPGTVSLYAGKDCVRKGIPTEDAVDALVELIKSGGRWREPTSREAALPRGR